MGGLSTARILFVDDEPNVLAGIRRTLAGYRVDVAESGTEGLALLEASRVSDPYAVVFSDMKMPVMNGAEFLRRARGLLPDAVLLILSGQSDLPSTIAAVNDANLFRFLSKPCPPEALRAALQDALRQHDLVEAERQLLQRTLTESVAVLAQVLGIADPQAFSRSERVRSVVERAAPAVGLGNDWELRIASMLSQLGCVAVPQEIMERVRLGLPLDEGDRSIFAGHPEVARGLIKTIPRLDRVARWIGDQPLSGRGGAARDWDRPQALLYATLDFLAGIDAGEAPAALAQGLSGSYPPEIISAVREAVPRPEARADRVVEVMAVDITIGMVLIDDLVTRSGIMLLRRDEMVTAALLPRLRNFCRSVGIVEPIKAHRSK